MATLYRAPPYMKAGSALNRQWLFMVARLLTGLAVVGGLLANAPAAALWLHAGAQPVRAIYATGSYIYDDYLHLSSATASTPVASNRDSLWAMPTTGLTDRTRSTAAFGFAAEGEGIIHSAGSSKLLGENLEASGVARPAETAAHHIVAGGAEAAAPARGVLTQYEIDVNSAENGVFLPRNLGSENPFGAAVHSTLHTGAYYDSVNEMLLGANSADEVVDTLAYLRESLQGGGL